MEFVIEIVIAMRYLSVKLINLQFTLRHGQIFPLRNGDKLPSFAKGAVS